jgi:hypothetical protein
LVHGSVYHGVVRVVGCTAVEGLVASDVGLVVDTTPPVYDMGDGARDVLFLYARPTLVYANFLQVCGACGCGAQSPVGLEPRPASPSHDIFTTPPPSLHTSPAPLPLLPLSLWTLRVASLWSPHSSL